MVNVLYCQFIKEEKETRSKTHNIKNIKNVLPFNIIKNNKEEIIDLNKKKALKNVFYKENISMSIIMENRNKNKEEENTITIMILVIIKNN